MRKKSLIRKLAVLLIAVIFTESTWANTSINISETETESVSDIRDSEHSEEAAETTTDYISGDETITPAGAYTDEELLPCVRDSVLSDSALDYELNTEGIPDYAADAAMSNAVYSKTDENSKFYLNRYIGVREDTMTECENNGLSIKESIPFALLMQRLEFNYSSAEEMMVYYGSQTAALDAAMEYRKKEYETGFLSQEDIKPELVDLLKEGYNTDEITKCFALAYCMGTDIKSIMTKEKSAAESNGEIFERAIEESLYKINLFGINISAEEENTEEKTAEDESALSLGNKYCVKAEYISAYMAENNITAEEMEAEIYAVMTELDIAHESGSAENLLSEIQPYSTDGESTACNLKNDSAYKEGPFNYKSGVNDNVDVGTGLLTYTDNVLSLPSKNGLDLNISLMYFSKNCKARSIDDRINYGRNWRYSFPFLMTNDGSRISAKKENGSITYNETPVYIVMADGTTYPIEDRAKKENRYISHCQTDNLYLNCDFNSKGGKDSCFELTHMDGTMDYFNKEGQWIATVNRFGNSIKITGDTETADSETVTIQDTLGKTVTIMTKAAAQGYEQTVTRPDNTVIKYIYETITADNGLTRTLLKEKREMTDSTNTISTKYEYEYSSGNTASNMGDSAKNMLLTKITYPTGMVSHYEYDWYKRYYIRNNILYRESNSWRAQYIWKLNSESEPKVIKRWVTVNGIDKDIEKFSYDELESKYKNGEILKIPAGYGNLYEEGTEIALPSRNDDLTEIVADTFSSEFEFEGSNRVYTMTAVNSDTYKSYICYGFDEKRRNTLTEGYSGSGLYLKVVNRYDTDPLHNLYPVTRTTYEGNSVKIEDFRYGTGNYFQYNVSDKENNLLYFERTDYDYGRLSEEHYSLPLRKVQKMSDTQSIVTDYILVNNSTGNSKRTIGEEKIYLQTNGTNALKARSVYSCSSTDLGRLTERKDYINSADFVTTAYTYGSSHAGPVSQEFNDGSTKYKTSYEYDSLGHVNKIISPKNFTTSYTYDKIGNVTKESFSGGTISTVRSYAYNYTGNTITSANENGKRIRYNYDQAGNLTSVTDMENNNNTLEKYTYDIYMRPTTQTLGGAVTTLTYDSRDRVISREVKNSGGTRLYREDYAYAVNSAGVLLTTMVQGDGNACSYSTSVQQDVMGRIISETNRQGGVTAYTNDLMGNVTKAVYPANTYNYTVNYTYDHAGNVLTETESGSRVETNTKNYEYDMLGRLTGFTDGKGKKTSYTYCGTDWIKEIKTPFSGTSYGVTSYQYDKAGNVTRESVSTGSGTRNIDYTYDALNRVTESKINNVSASYEYDKAGNITKQTTANGAQSVTYSYDWLNRPVKYTDALGKSETYTYNNYGDMIKKTDRNGITTNYTYDALHRLTQEKATKNNVTASNSYTYSLTGSLASESSGSVTKSYRYYKGDNGRICDEENVTVDGTSYKTVRLYNDADRMHYVQCFKDGSAAPVYTKNYSYDAKGRIYMFGSQAASDYANGTNSSYDVYYTYDKNDNMTGLSVKNGLTSAYTYNDANLLTSLVNKNSTGTLSSCSYTYTPDGNMSRKTENGNTTAYSYDGAGRLTRESFTANGKTVNMAYAYDSAGNRSSLTVTGGESYVTSYTYDRNNRLLKSSRKNSGAGYADTVIYTYDNNGNQIRKDMSRENLTGKPELGFFADSGDSGYGYEIFTYNGLNQLVKLEDEMKNTAEYTYMANGLRFSKSVKGNKTSFLWDGDGLMMTVTADEIRSYAKSPGYMRTGTSKELSSHNTKLYIFNGHGDVAGMTDKSGNLEKTYSYDAFGNELNPDSSDTNPFRYCGEYYDDELESIYLRARNYNPSTGRFTTEDPIKDGLNWYAYCGGNPVMFVDPSGLDLQIIGYKTLSDAQKKQIKSDLNKLMMNDIDAGTYDAIVEVSGEGNVTLNVLTENPSTEGYKILDTIIGSDNIIAINFDTSPVEKGDTKNNFTINKRNGVDTGVGTINYNINSSFEAYVVDDSSGERVFKKEVMTSTISLGHELVHAYRYVTGQNIDDLKLRTTYTGVLPPGISKESKSNYSEELETVGLVEWKRQNSSGRITENDLRTQLGMPKRGWY
ncbi:MAG: RHS repeat-associated core domain-containing protein [Clostridia bacterium]|nr:RHS repeat-associated core domain-containing protein [Clostridia bacterium]